MGKVQATVADGPFEATWESLEKYRVPEWYVDGKFGIFIHWGVYAVPGFGNEWYPREMYQEGSKEFAHHVKTYGTQSKFGYKDFIPMFKAEKFEPAKWAELFRKAGAKFVVPVAEHHDGFAMYDCGLSKWCATKMGPKRDIIGDLAKEVRKEGLVLGLSSHRIEHCWFFDGGMKFESDVKDPKYRDFYGPAQMRDTPPSKEFMQDWLERTCELVDKYEPQIVWFDWWIEQPVMKPYLKRFAAYYYNRAAQWGKGVAINYKNDAYTERSAVFDIERGQMAGIRREFWQTDTAVGKNSWGYVKNMEYKTSGGLIGDLVDIVSKNGAMLLNIGPRPDGVIPQQDQAILLEIGKWLKVNGEAIYGTRPWKVFGEGPTEVMEGGFTDTKRGEYVAGDVRFTTRGQGTVYAIGLAWPKEGAEVVIESLGSNLRLYTDKIKSVELVGAKEAVKWERLAGGLKVKLPGKRPAEHAFALRITRA